MISAGFAASVAQGILMIALAPLFAGVLCKLKARMQRRSGCGLLQPYRDVAKLFRKAEKVSDSASWLFRAVPYACFGSMALLSFMTPFMLAEVAAPFGDLVAMVYVFTLYRFMMVLGGLEGGSVFGGMGSSRETMMSVLIEPSLLLAVMALAGLAGGGTDMGGIPGSLIGMGVIVLSPALILAAASFFITLLAENARIPFDNPSTHLELTMVHEGMLLEYSGRGLGLMELSSMMRLTIFASMLCSLFFPWGIALSPALPDLAAGLASVLLKMLAAMAAIALIESYLAKYRLFKLPNLLTASFALSLLAMISLYIL
ncbi:MAG: NADH-quinone oxidoreductase subunit H [Candidatus Methanoplasma sp.]|jgi:formate hydrogenlyase subunit 4|nr:NADH-quinone oxidoreductase subunit H [Candidatus Methanoplasma sp.]